MFEAFVLHVQGIYTTTMQNHFWLWVTIPIVAAFVTWVHVWMALKMVFLPIKFWGLKIGPIPLGWQGIVPRKAGKISGIIVDQTLNKLGSLHEFLHAMDPVEMAQMIGNQVGDELEHLIDELMTERSDVIWSNIPASIKRRIYANAHKLLPGVLRGVVTELTYNVETLVDMRAMVVRQMENDRKLMVSMFLRVGQREVDFIWHISAFIGLFFGVVQMLLWLVVPWHWTIIFWAALWGLLTNWIAIWMVFNPIEPVHIKMPKLFKRIASFPYVRPTLPHIGTYAIQGAFMQRQAEVSEVFAEIITREIITLKNIMTEMMFGDRKEQTRRILKLHINAIMDAPLVRTTLQLSIGFREYAALKSDVVDKSILVTMGPLANPVLNRSRADKVFTMFRDRISALSPPEFQNLLRPAFQEDEWILIVLGGLTGALAGWVQYFFGFI